jgi:hypothetical protein
VDGSSLDPAGAPVEGRERRRLRSGSRGVRGGSHARTSRRLRRCQHRFKDPQTAFSRGEKLIKNEDAPPGVRGLQFYPSRDQSFGYLPLGGRFGGGHPALRRLPSGTRARTRATRSMPSRHSQRGLWGSPSRPQSARRRRRNSQSRASRSAGRSLLSTGAEASTLAHVEPASPRAEVANRSAPLREAVFQQPHDPGAGVGCGHAGALVGLAG